MNCMSARPEKAWQPSPDSFPGDVVFSGVLLVHSCVYIQCMLGDVCVYWAGCPCTDS